MIKRLQKSARMMIPLFTATALSTTPGLAAEQNDSPEKIFWMLGVHDFAVQAIDMPQKYLDLLPDDSNIMVTNVVHDDTEPGLPATLVTEYPGVAPRFSDSALPLGLFPIFNKCVIFSYTRPHNVIAYMEKVMGITIEPEAKLDPVQLTARIYLHEIAHCQDPNVMWSPIMIRESFADLNSIAPLHTLEPVTNIDRVIIAWRTIERGYLNAAMVERALSGSPMTNEDMIADTYNDALADYYLSKIAKDMAHPSDTTETKQLKNLLLLRYLRDHSAMLKKGYEDAPLDDYIRLRIEAFEIFQPTASARADVLYERLTALANFVRIKPAGSVPAQP